MTPNPNARRILDLAVAGLPEGERPRAEKVLGDLHGEDGQEEESEVLAQVTDGALADLAGKMVRDRYREFAADKAAELAKKKSRLSCDAFWIGAHELLDLEEGDYFFHAATATIRRRPKSQKEVRSIHRTVEAYRKTVGEILGNPVMASCMAHDDRLPVWLRSFAKAIVEPGFRPGLRRIVEESLDDPKVARQWIKTGAEDGLPDWMVDMFQVLGAGGKSSL